MDPLTDSWSQGHGCLLGAWQSLRSVCGGPAGWTGVRRWERVPAAVWGGRGQPGWPPGSRLHLPNSYWVSGRVSSSACPLKPTGNSRSFPKRFPAGYALYGHRVSRLAENTALGEVLPQICQPGRVGDPGPAASLSRLLSQGRFCPRGHERSLVVAVVGVLRESTGERPELLPSAISGQAQGREACVARCHSAEVENAALGPSSLGVAPKPAIEVLGIDAGVSGLPVGLPSPPASANLGRVKAAVRGLLLFRGWGQTPVPLWSLGLGSGSCPALRLHHPLTPRTVSSAQGQPGGGGGRGVETGEHPYS